MSSIIDIYFHSMFQYFYIIYFVKTIPIPLSVVVCMKFKMYVHE